MSRVTSRFRVTVRKPSPNGTASVPAMRSTGSRREMRSGSYLLPVECPARRTVVRGVWRFSIRQRSGSASGRRARQVVGGVRVAGGAARIFTGLAPVAGYEQCDPDRQRLTGLSHQPPGNRKADTRTLVRGRLRSRSLAPAIVMHEPVDLLLAPDPSICLTRLDLLLELPEPVEAQIRL